MYYFKILSLLILIMSIGITTFAQESEQQHKEDLPEMMGHYLAAKDALTEDDFEAARSSLSEFKEKMNGNDTLNDHKEHTEKHAQIHTRIIEAIDKAVQAENISGLRSAFKVISSNLTKILEAQGYDEDTLYIHYCPMADNKQGATWISAKEKIVNPYMGQSMPGCGELKKEINPNR